MSKPILSRTVSILLCLAMMISVGVISAFAETKTEEINNLFVQSDKVVFGAIDKNNEFVESNEYATSDYIAVKEGDVLYFGAAYMTQRQHLALQDANKKGIGNVSVSYLTIHEELGRNYAIYSYKIPQGVSYVRVIAQLGVYLDGETLVTLNQPFGKEQYCELFDIKTEYEGILKDKNVLILGDELALGLHENASYSTPNLAWGGRLERDTGASITNLAIPGAAIAKRGSQNWISWQYLPVMENHYDLIIINGGMNDAFKNVSPGTALSTDASEEELIANQETFIGGLQWLFYVLRQTQPNAEIVYISTYRLDWYESSIVRNMDPYFGPARRLCPKYDVHYVNLNQNDEVNDAFQSETSTEYLPDHFSPNSKGYDVIYPFIYAAVEEAFNGKLIATTQTTDHPIMTFTTEATTESSIETTAPVTDPTTAATTAAPDKKNGGCKGTLGSASMLVAALGIAAFVMRKKKED